MVNRKALPEDSSAASNDNPNATPIPPQSNPWGDDPNDSPWEDVAQRLQTTSMSTEGVPVQTVPPSLRPGAAATGLEAEENAWDDGRAAGMTPTLDKAPDLLRPGPRAETNPFLRKRVPSPQPAPPAESFSQMGSGEPSSNPWQPAISAQHTGSTMSQPQPQPPSIPQPSLLDDDAKDPWVDDVMAPQHPALAPSPVMVNLPSRGDSPAWDDDPLGPPGKVPLSPVNAMSSELAEDEHVWDDIGSANKGKANVTGSEPSNFMDDWNMVEGESSTNAAKGTQDELTNDNPPLPPRRPTEPAAWKPTREPVDGKTETYQVKNVTWHDASASKNPRTSPILIQNANGPCPLVALVNALSLTTPGDEPDTAMVHVLRSREQISLDLLLQAVLDELMSPRRTNSDDQLPDVTDLYSFLQSLHTGMNVNPRFIPTERMVNAYKRTSLTHLHPTERGDLIPGTFENTAEMGLYATFSIPLIHGWLPSQNDPAYEALARQAASYEDAQNLLFREEELEGKLFDPEQGLSESEQQLYQDILTIRGFLESSATQLTPWGIEVIGKAIRPGTFAILFRNDHFSTLYCHPQTMQLLTLVTDAGFKSHAEIVWETLSDVNGERTEFLSGDFLVVGSGATLALDSAANYQEDQGGEWTTVQGRRGKARQTNDTPLSPSTEQEDRDLALALQLQEEEDERHRAAEARRRRESILSEQYIEQQGRQPSLVPRRGSQGSRGGLTPQQSGITSRNGSMSQSSATRSQDSLTPIRTSSNTVPVTTNAQRRPTQQVVRPLIPPRRPGVNRPGEEGTDDAPPSYEQAAHDPAYVPPVGHPSHAASSPSTAPARTPARTGAPGGLRPSNRRPPVNPTAVLGTAPQSRDKDCVVM